MTGRSPMMKQRRRPLHLSSVVIVLAFYVYETVGALVNEEGVALLAFKGGLSDPLGYLSTWNEMDPNPCSWYGITCDTNFNVTKVLLQGTELSGQISPQLRNLTSLRMLVLSRNNLSGPIPPELSEIGTLWKLNLSQNALSGNIPTALGNLFSLRMLDLSANTFSGPIPSALFKFCGRMRYISLATNQLSGPIPATLWNCTKLDGFDLSSNGLQGSIPQDIGRLEQLNFVALQGNKLSGPIPSQLGLLTNVRLVDVSSNKLSGGIPSEIGSMSALIFFRLGKNPIGGLIPSQIGKLIDLQVLEFSNMDLQGSIPSTIANCTSLLSLDVSNNNLSGSIPAAVGDIVGLKELDLQFNTLSGSIPVALGNLQALTSFNVSYNNLSGVILTANALGKFNETSYLGNPGLCGSPSSTTCLLVPTPATLLPVRSRLLSASAIIAISFAGAVAIGVIVVTLLSIRALRRQKQVKTELLVYESTPPSPDVSPIVGKLVLFNKVLPSRYEDWEAGTKALLDKECVIGRGSLGTVYRATFDGGLSVAVKKLETLGRIKSPEEFESEMNNVGDIRHHNLVTLQGYYWSSTMQLMLSDYISNGTLSSHLHRLNASQTTLFWSRRYRIALGVARGLAYLHHDFRSQVVHFNLTPANILLDESFEPKISDYGLGKFLPILDTYISARKSHATLGYVAPELAGQSLRLSEKCDVYSYGVVLLELVTGQQPDEDAVGSTTALAEFVRSTLEQGRGVDCIDPKLNLFPESEVMQVLKLALVCTAQVPAKRPSIAEAVQVLESIKPSGSWTSRSPSP